MGFFDTLLTAIAPERAVKRVAAQTAIRAINSGYSNYGASLHKKSMRGWMWHGGSPKEDIEDNLRVLRERSRDAYMGVPLATGAIKTMRTNVVCGGLTPTPQIDNAFLGISDEEAQKINEQIAREFALWANKPTCDADRIDNFYMLQQLAFTGFLLNGDSWAVLQNKKTPGVPYDLRVRIIEADRICSPAFMDILSPTDINEHHVEKIVQGVETDADGMVIAYWVCDRHPLASTSVTGLTASHWTRVEAYGKKTGRQNVLCLMQRERAGQLRGVPLLAPVLESLKQLGRFTDAELTAAVISAMFTVFIKKSDQSDEVPFGEMLPPDVQVDMTLEDVNNLVTEIYTRNYKAVNGTAPPLHSADPITLTLKSISELYYMVLQVAEKRTRCALLKTATGAALDNMGLPFGVKRNEATYATVTIRFNLSAEQKTVVMIPHGTRVRTAAGIYFATTAYAQIAIGETYVDVLAQAEVVGASGNDVPIGVVDTLVDAIPYVAAVENVDTSSGGADAESDDSLTRRIWLSPTTYSCAGPRDAYEYWAMSFRSDVENAIAVSPRSQPCTVYIFFMLTGGRMPSEKDMSEMQAYLMNEARRPMTDQVICKAPEEVEYGIDFTYYIGAGNAKGASIVQENVAKAVEEFQQWQRSIGRDISPMELIYRLRVAGVKRVELRQPVYMVVEGGSDLEKATVQIPKLSGTPTIIYGGVEDD